MRKQFLFLALLGATLASSCARPEQNTTTACAAAGATVRTVTDAAGTVTFDQALQRYKIMAAQPGTVDVVDVGVVCGTLPQDLQKEGAKVVFSGTYKTYPTPPAAPAGYTTYYLEVASIKVQ